MKVLDIIQTKGAPAISVHVEAGHSARWTLLADMPTVAHNH
jgi:hypothetical protein